MLLYCLKGRKNTKSKNPKAIRTKNRTMFLSKCALFDSKKSRFVKEQGASGLLSSLGHLKSNSYKKVEFYCKGISGYKSLFST